MATPSLSEWPNRLHVRVLSRLVHGDNDALLEVMAYLRPHLHKRAEVPVTLLPVLRVLDVAPTAAEQRAQLQAHGWTREQADAREDLLRLDGEKPSDCVGYTAFLHAVALLVRARASGRSLPAGWTRERVPPMNHNETAASGGGAA